MSDETNDTTNYGNTAPGESGATAGTAERVGFCQDCGTPLTRETARPVGAGVFCEPCLAARVGTTATGNSQSGYTTVPPVAGGPVPASSVPHPVLAGFLGLIPGVGAMYNGQYAKGIAHLVIFVVLTSLADHADMFGVIVAGWVFYQVFDAYHTAKAQLEGRPLPNPFGLNDIGERMGFGRPAGTAPAAGAGTPTGNTTASYSAPGSTSYGTAYSQPYTPPYVPPYVPPTSGPDWVGYVPPTNFAGAPPVTPTGAAGAAWGQAPYGATYTGSDVSGTPLSAARRFPLGAIWLIGLGIVFLLFEFGQQWGWSLNMNWVLALLFAGLAAMTAARRLRPGVQAAFALRWPVVLGVLAVLFGLQAMNVASLGRTWPVLLVALGAMLIVERTALSQISYGAPAYPASASVVPPMDEAFGERSRASWATTTDPAHTLDATHNIDVDKDGQAR